jgi:hypothetical protein
MRTPVAALALLSALALTACETPRESCINQASRELRIVESLIAETRCNLDRGYAIEREQDVRVVRDFCRVRDEEEGDIDLVRCNRTEVDEVERPVTIDLAQERVKLEQLLERREGLAAEQSARLRACVATYPE